MANDKVQVSIDIGQLREYAAQQARDAQMIVNLCDGATGLQNDLQAATAKLKESEAVVATLRKELEALKGAPQEARQG